MNYRILDDVGLLEAPIYPAELETLLFKS